MIENRETTEEIFQEKLHNYIKKTVEKVKHGNGGMNLLRIMESNREKTYKT